MATAKPKEAPVEGEEAPKKSKKMLFIIIGVVVLLLAGGAGYYFLGMKKEPADAEVEKKVAAPKDPIYIVLDPFTLNLRGGGQYLQIGITLQMEDEKEGSKLKVYLPTARSRLLMLLSNKTADEVSDDEGKQALKDELKAALEEPFVKNAEPVKVGEVLFTSFVVQ